MTSLLDVLPGARRPRTCSVPPYSSSAGQEAVDLAASAGLALDPWQQDVLRASLGERPDGNWSAFEVGLIVPRQNGKGTILEARELFGLVLAREPMILHSAHLFKTSKEAFRRVLRLFQETADLDRLIARVAHTHGDEGIELTNGCRLSFVARSKGGGRGLSGDVLILDEAFAVTDDQVEALMPTMSARPNGQIWYTSSPPLDAIAGAPLFALRARGEAGDPGVAWFDWGADPAADFDDPRVWAETNPAYNIRIMQETVERERRAMTPDGFGRERLGIWPKTAADQWQVIPESAWTAASDGRSESLDPVAFAVDVTPDRQWACIAVAGRRADGRRHVEVVEHRRGTSWVVTWLAGRVKTWKPCAVVVDAGSPAASLLADFEAAKVEVVTTSARDVAQACGALFDGIAGEELAGRDIRYLPHGALTAAVAGATKRKLGDAWAWDRLNSSVDISPLVAATLALWGHAAHAHLARSAAPWATYA